MALVKSVTFIPMRWLTFCAADAEKKKSKTVELKDGRKRNKDNGQLVEVSPRLGRTGVVGHGGLVRVALLLEAHVPELQHRGHHLQQACMKNKPVNEWGFMVT